MTNRKLPSLAYRRWLLSLLVPAADVRDQLDTQLQQIHTTAYRLGLGVRIGKKAELHFFPDEIPVLAQEILNNKRPRKKQDQ